MTNARATITTAPPAPPELSRCAPTRRPAEHLASAGPHASSPPGRRAAPPAPLPGDDGGRPRVGAVLIACGRSRRRSRIEARGRTMPCGLAVVGLVLGSSWPRRCSPCDRRRSAAAIAEPATWDDASRRSALARTSVPRCDAGTRRVRCAPPFGASALRARASRSVTEIDSAPRRDASAWGPALTIFGPTGSRIRLRPARGAPSARGGRRVAAVRHRMPRDHRCPLGHTGGSRARAVRGRGRPTPLALRDGHSLPLTSSSSCAVDHSVHPTLPTPRRATSSASTSAARTSSSARCRRTAAARSRCARTDRADQGAEAVVERIVR